MLVVLRLAIGWHFLYEGIWKIRHADQFVGEMEGFLSGARGPVADFFYRLVPDIDGHQRLEADLIEVDGKDAAGKPVKIPKLAKSWDDLRQKFVDFYRPAAPKDGNDKLHEQLTEEAAKVYQRHVKGLKEFVKENGDKIKAHFDSLNRYEEGLKTDPHTMFQRQRRWDEMQDLRKEAKGWIADLEGRENALKSDLLDLLRKERKSEVQSLAKADAKPAVAADSKKSETSAVMTKSGITSLKPAEKKSKNVKPESGAEDKPSDPPKDTSAEPAKTKSKESADSGSVESGDKDEGKPDEPKADVKADKSPRANGDAEGAKPHAAEKSKDDAGATAIVDVIDFSPLAIDRPEKGPFARSSNILSWKRTEQMALLLSWTLAAVGLCLMLGLFTRPAALVGAAFLVFVVLSQPSYNGVFPLDPPQLGHALVVNKDFVEMIALLLIASTRLGRWTGLDFFIHTCLVKPFCCQSGNCTTTEGRKA